MKHLNKFGAQLKNQEGRVGYLVAWMLGVPASVLFFIFLLRGH
ncbi:MAG: hypothetical protein AB7K68_17160 [Bacteriovoracia bacterium]